MITKISTGNDKILWEKNDTSLGLQKENAGKIGTNSNKEK